jgi:hypothetical protein
VKLILQDGRQVLIAHQEAKEISSNADHAIVRKAIADLLDGNVKPRSFKLQDPVAEGIAVASLWHGPRQLLLAPSTAAQLAGGSDTFSSTPSPQSARCRAAAMTQQRALSSRAWPQWCCPMRWVRSRCSMCAFVANGFVGNGHSQSRTRLT